MKNELREYFKKQQYRMAKESLIDYDEVDEKYKSILLNQICLCVDVRFKDIWLNVFKDRKECVNAFNVL